MRLHLLEQRQKLPIQVDEAWAFFSAPRNLAAMTPPSMRLRFTTPPPEAMYAGMLLSYRLDPLFGVPVDWVQEITHVAAPHRFVDEQRFGPYRFLHHQHLFREIGGGVEMHDLLHYALPRGGGAAHRLLVAPALRELFAYRRQVLERTFGAWTGE
jgi:ligand-binding SRPBCC domain-containing protein